MLFETLSHVIVILQHSHVRACYSAGYSVIYVAHCCLRPRLCDDNREHVLHLDLHEHSQHNLRSVGPLHHETARASLHQEALVHARCGKRCAGLSTMHLLSYHLVSQCRFQIGICISCHYWYSVRFFDKNNNRLYGSCHYIEESSDSNE